MIRSIRHPGTWLMVAAGLWTAAQSSAPPALHAAEVVVAEGEFFQPQGPGWAVTPMDESYASHSYGGMWLTHGACLGAAADSREAVAVQAVTIPAAGAYRVWSKYQSPPYFNYLHRIEVHQRGRKVFEHVYGKKGTDRLWSFSGQSDELWWFWGVDHDAAEAPKNLVQLAAGPAEIRLVTVANPAPAGRRFVDFVVLTTEPGDAYQGFKPYGAASPFTLEALAQSRVFVRFKNSSAAPTKLKLATPTGHYQPVYAARATEIPEAGPVPPGQWSPWVNIGPLCRLVHDEGIIVSLPGASGPIAIEAARDAAGTDRAGAASVPDGDAFVVPLDLPWNKQKAAFGPQAETGANYSPHGMPMYYGPIEQWIDIFKQNGMTMYWAEDYVFSVPMPPQIISWMLATVRCGVKYNKQKVHFYVMPHAPGQRADFLRRSMIYAPGAGVNHVDNFWVAPPESFTENFVAWGYTDTYRVIHESIFDTAEAEPLLAGAAVRPGRVAVLLSKATDHNERLAQIPKSQDALMAGSKNAPATVQQTLGRVEAQMLYLAILHGQHRVDLVTEDDVAADNILSKYDVLHVAGEWIDHRLPPKLEAWVKDGGVLYASGGLGIFNEFNEADPALLKVLGLAAAEMSKNLAVIRPVMELPVAPPIGEIAFAGGKIPAVVLKQTLVPADAKVLGTWADGKPAVTVREIGKGKAFAVGTLAGCAYQRTALAVQPFPRGGNLCPVTPTEFDPAAAKLARLGVDAKPVEEPAVCDNPFVEAIVMDGPAGSVLTLANWTAEPVRKLTVKVRLPAKPKEAKSVQAGQTVPAEFKDGVLTLTTDLEWADHILLPK